MCLNALAGRLSSGIAEPHPGLASAFEIRSWRIEEEHQRCRAREAVKLAVIGILPVQRTVRLDLHTGVQTDRVVVLELPLHRARVWHDSFPNSLASIGAIGARTQ